MASQAMSDSTSPKITCYLKTYCGWSEGVRSVLRKHDLTWDEKDVVNNPEHRAEMIERRFDIGAALAYRQLFGEIDLCRHRAFRDRLGSAHQLRPESIEVAQLASQNLTHRGLR